MSKLNRRQLRKLIREAYSSILKEEAGDISSISAALDAFHESAKEALTKGNEFTAEDYQEYFHELDSYDVIKAYVDSNKEEKSPTMVRCLLILTNVMLIGINIQRKEPKELVKELVDASKA
jgi:hypothetical protein